MARLTQPLPSSSFLRSWAITAELHTAAWKVRVEAPVRVPWPSFPPPPSMGNVNSQQTQLPGTCASRHSWTHEDDGTKDSPVYIVHCHPTQCEEILCALVKIFCWDFLCVWSSYMEHFQGELKPCVKGTWVLVHLCPWMTTRPAKAGVLTLFADVNFNACLRLNIHMLLTHLYML